MLRANDTVIDEFDASPKYLVVANVINGQDGVWVMSRQNGTWWNVQKVPGASATEPKVDGDWCVYYEHNPNSTAWPGGLVGIYLPTGQRYELARNPPGIGYTSWDTDGKYLVAEALVDGFEEHNGPYAYTADAAYPGSSNIYWKELPAVPQ